MLRMDEAAIRRFRLRRLDRLITRLDDEEEEEPKGGGGHGNTRIPFGLCQREGISIEKGWTPSDAWAALEGKGYSVKNAYKELQESGHVTDKSKAQNEKPNVKADFDSAKKTYEDSIDRIKKEVEEEANRKLEEIKKKKAEVYKRHKEDDEAHINAIRERRKKENDFLTSGNENLRKEVDELIEKERQAKEKLQETTEEYNRLGKEEGAIAKGVKEEQEKRIFDSPEAKAYRSAIRDRFPAYDDCNTNDEIADRAWASENYKPGARLDLGALPVEDARKVAGIADNFCERCPVMKGHLNSIEYGTTYSSTAYAAEKKDGRIILNEKKYGVPGYVKEHYAENVRVGFHPAGCDENHIIYHELTHAFEDYVNSLNRKYNRYGEPINRKDDLSAVVLRRVSRKLGMSSEETKIAVSKYAKDSDYKKRKMLAIHAEFLEEAYGEYMNSPHPREVATAVGETINEILRERGLL